MLTVQVTQIMSGLGTELVITSTAGDDIAVRAATTTSTVVEVLQDGVPLVGIPAIDPATLARLTVVGDDGNNVINLSTVTGAFFNPNLEIIVDGDDGDDFITGSLDIASTLNGGDGTDVLFGGTQADSLSGGNGQDLLNGGDGNDTLNGGDGGDIINGEVGDDVVNGGSSGDTINGGSGADTISGQSGSDSILGDTDDDVIDGGSGSDTIDGGIGDDSISGGAEPDSLLGNVGLDTLNGDGGNDSLFGGDDDDILFGGTDDDVLNGENGNDIVNGNSGNDTALGSSDDDTVLGGSGNDLVLGGVGDDVARGQGGDDTIRGGGGADTLDGGAGDDFVSSFLGEQGNIAASATVSVSDVSVAEANGGATTADFVINISNVSGGAVEIAFATQDGTATAGSDYFDFSGSVVFLAGETQQTVSVPILDDVAAEGDETFTLTVSSSMTTLSGTTTGTATIVDNDSTMLVTLPVAGLSPALTWGVVPDGTTVPGLCGSPANAPSTLIAHLDGIYNETATGPDVSNRTWFAVVQSVFDRFEELTGIDFVHEPNDDGITFGPGNDGILGTRPDIRVSGVDMAVGTLGCAFGPPGGGDFGVDTGGAFNNTTLNSRLLRNTIGHELGHSIGFGHVRPNDQTKLMEGGINLAFDGPQFDDILRFQRQYGDVYETVAGNDSSANATALGAVDFGQTLSIGTDGLDTTVAFTETDFISIDGTSDTDFLSVVLPASAIVEVTLTPVGPTYQKGEPSGAPPTAFDTSVLNDLTLEFLDLDGTTVLGSSNIGGTGVAETVTGLTLTSEGTYFARITGSIDQVQMYQLDVSVSATTPIDPDTLIDVGDTINGGTGNDTIIGSRGDDLIDGQAGNDSLEGGGGDDTLISGAGNDTLSGGDGEDTVSGGEGNNTVTGGSGSDVLILEPFANGGNTALDTGGADSVEIRGTAGADSFTISQVGGLLRVSTSAASITVSESVHTVRIVAMDGADTVTMGNINDTRPLALIVDLGEGADTFDGQASFANRLPIQVLGQGGDDTITGSANGDILNGGDGDDMISGDLGEDSIRGGAGNDTLFGDNGNDQLLGEDGADSLFGGTGNDLMQGGNDDDRLNGNSGHDTLEGELGNDTILAGAGNDLGRGGSGSDSIKGQSGFDTLFGGGGNDTIRGEAGDDVINGGDGDDTIVGGFGRDLVTGGEGSDQINGSSGDDTLLGDDGDDSIIGGAGADILLGGDGDDRLSGSGSNADTVAGNEGDDNLTNNQASEIDETFVLADEILAMLIDTQV